MGTSIAQRVAPPLLLLPQGTIGIGTEGNVGFWNGTGWTDYGTPGGWTLDWLYFS